jgi:Flp pilus assembly protein TadD
MRGRKAGARKQRLVERAGVPLPDPGDDPVEALITRARKARRKGEARRAVVLLRQACALDERRARAWALLGALLSREGTVDEAVQAFKQARFLCARAGEKARAEVIERLTEQLRTAA